MWLTSSAFSFYISFKFFPLSMTKQNMAAARTALMRLATVTILIEMTMAATYTVGGPNGGWDTTTDLKTWTSSQTFLVGDNLNFQYGPSHNVIEVPKADYDACTSSNSIQRYSDGSDTIPLSSPGKRYFICGIPGHCSQGMKLEVNTLASNSAAPTPATISPAPVDSPSNSSPSSTETPAPESSSTNASPAQSPASPGSNPTDIPSTEAPTSISRTGSSPQPSASALNCKLSGATVGFSAVIMLFVAPLRF